ncbi:MAG: NADH:flavin oxidoreductase [Coriobacteriia bacterium]|nr:NADH:flavin oxidoreductase [Coriobacteriia bacterium]
MSRLLEPLATRNLALHNRLVLPPMATSKANPDGSMSDALLAYYDEKSRGGAFGLIITEHCYITRQGMNRVGQPSIADDSTIDAWKRLTETIHANGSKVAMQINHCGGACSTEATGLEVVGPSDVAVPLGRDETVRELTHEEIATIVTQFADAARRVKAAGFDGVEIHAAHGYLLTQLFSPLTNKRTDQYGGEVHGRIRFHLQVIAAVRAAVGDDFPVLLRLGARDYIEGGTTLTDSQVAAVEFERAGVDILDITGGLSGYTVPGNDEPGWFAELSEGLKAVVDIPVMLTGGVTEPAHAEALLAAGSADLIGVGRAVLKDSGWALRAVRELAG